MKATKIVR